MLYLNWYLAKFGSEEKVLKLAHFNKILSQITPIFQKGFSERYAGILLTMLKINLPICM